MHGHLEFGDVLELRNYLRGYSPSVGDYLLYIGELPRKGTHVHDFLLGVRVSPKRRVPCCVKLTYPTTKV